MHVETHNPGAVPQRNGATSPIRPLAILGRPLMVLLLLAPALAANPPAYHRRALVELDNLDLGNGHSRAQAASLFAEESGEPLPTWLGYLVPLKSAKVLAFGANEIARRCSFWCRQMRKDAERCYETATKRL